MKLGLIGCLIPVFVVLLWANDAKGTDHSHSAGNLAAGPLPKDAVARLGSQRFVHSGRIVSLAFTPDGSGLLTVSQEGACLWDLTNAQPRRVFAKPFICGAFSLDGQTVVLAENGPTIDIFDAATSTLKTQMASAKNRTSALDLSTDGLLAASADEGDILLWDLSDPSTMRRIKVNETRVPVVRFSPDGHHLAYAGARGWEMRILNLAEGSNSIALEGNPGFEPWFVFSPDGSRVMASCEVSKGDLVYSSFRCWDTASGKILYNVPGSFASAAMSPDGRTVAVAGVENVFIFAVATGAEIRRLPRQRLHVWALAFSPDGRTLASGEDQRVRLWRTDTFEEINPGVGHSEPIQGVAFSPDSSTIITGGLDGRLIEWNWPLADEKRCVEGVGSGWGVQHLTFSPDGKWLAIAAWINNSEPFFLFDSKSLLAIESFGNEYPWADPLAFLTDTNEIRNLDDKSVWHLRDGQVVFAKAPSNDIISVFSRDGHFSATVEFNRIVLREILSGKEIRQFQTETGKIKALAFSPDDSLLVTSDYDDALVWDLTGRWKDGVLEKTSLTQTEMTLLWYDLADEDAHLAYRSAWKLAAGGSASVAFIADHLHAAASDPDYVAELRARLTSNTFDDRLTAARQLHDMGIDLRPDETNLLGRPNPMVDAIGRSVGYIYPKKPLQPLPYRLRSSRAIMALEHSASHEAAALLEALAQGVATAPQTIEAKAALAWRAQSIPPKN